MQTNLAEVATAWAALAGTVFVPHTEEEHNQIVALLDQLIDEVGEDESHPLGITDGDPWRSDRAL